MNTPMPGQTAVLPETSPEPYDPSVYKTLLESTRAIPWKIDWASMRFAYIGPQIEPLLGWTQESWATVDDWASRIHPDDRQDVVNFCVAQSQAGVDHEADYRALTRDGDYVWIRDVVHVMRTPDGGVDSLVGFMFDISAQKKNEQELKVLQQKLEALSFEDGLTGIANRRMFDTHLDNAFDNARISRRPLSLIMLDIDYFKQFNDLYGHIEGDDCLRKVAAALRELVAAPDAIAARYGGEEFAILLPNVDAAAARTLAELCMRRIDALKIPHAKSASGAFVTASLGVGTIATPGPHNPKDFTQGVDRLLYAAKEKGRNRIETALF